MSKKLMTSAAVFSAIMLALVIPGSLVSTAHGATDPIDSTIPLDLTVDEHGGRGSKLTGIGHDPANLKAPGTVVIQASDCGSGSGAPSSTPDCNLTSAQMNGLTSVASETAAICRSFFNEAPNDYFLPWATPREWGAFLKQVLPQPGFPGGRIAGITTRLCCLPEQAKVCRNQIYNGVHIGEEGIPVRDADGNPIQLGRHKVGSRTVLPDYYGAHRDVSDPIDASVWLGDASINYQVAYVCDNGTWVKTLELGSCTPLDGACGTDVPSTGLTMTVMQTLANENRLCSPGSIVQNLTDLGSYWSWTCAGTPGRTSATCTSNGSTSTDDLGQCGTANTVYNGWLDHQPSTPEELCSQGVPSTVSGDGLSDATRWRWTCTGRVSVGSCVAWKTGIYMDAECGFNHGRVVNDPTWMPTQNNALWHTYYGLYRNYLTPTIVTQTPTGWTWTCMGSGGGADASCAAHYDPTVALRPGACGTAAGVPHPLTPNGVAPYMCAYGGQGTVRSSGGLWRWTCTGDVGTPVASCSAPDTGTGNPPPSSANDGRCGAANGDQVASAPSSGLCAAGTASAVAGSGPWTWSCQGISGGATAVCSANPYIVTGPGQCGAAHGTTIPRQPNSSLCSVGAPGPVSGSGPWTWDCVGTTTVSCATDICDRCMGIPAPQSFSLTIPSQTISYGSGTCDITGTADMMQHGILSDSNASSTIILSNAASGLSMTSAKPAEQAAANFCPPCFHQPISMTGRFVVQRSGACATGNATLDGGGSITIPITSITIN